MSRFALYVSLAVLAAAISGCAVKSTTPQTVWGELVPTTPDTEPTPDEPQR